MSSFAHKTQQANCKSNLCWERNKKEQHGRIDFALIKATTADVKFPFAFIFPLSFTSVLVLRDISPLPEGIQILSLGITPVTSSLPAVMLVNGYKNLSKELIVEDVSMDRLQRCHVCEQIRTVMERACSRRRFHG